MISAHRDIRMHLFLMVAAVFMGGAALEATAQRVTDQKMLDAVRNIGIKNGYSVGAVAVQQFDKYGTEFYLGYRLYSLDRDVEPSVEDMHVGTVGARVKF